MSRGNSWGVCVCVCAFERPTSLYNLGPLFTLVRVDHLETIQQLLTAVVKKIPLITAKGKTVVLNPHVRFVKL